MDPWTFVSKELCSWCKAARKSRLPSWEEQATSAVRLIHQLKPAEKLGFVALCMAAASSIFLLERLSRELEAMPHLANRRQEIPNYNHLWSSTDLLFVNSDAASGQLTPFGRDFALRGGWKEVCQLDSDGDGVRNGEELGDPCCRWTSADAEHYFKLASQEEYRRWLLSDPGDPSSVSDTNSEPYECTVQARHGHHRFWVQNKYDPVTYHTQFHEFYYHGLERKNEPARFEKAQMFCFVVFLLTLWHWIWNKSLLQDLFPDTASKRGIGLGIFIASFFYLDLFSGVVHIILDYAPHWLPVLGRVAYGTQLHHHDPTNFLKDSFVDHVGHVHLILPVMPLLVFASNGSGYQRLWWFWCAIWAHLFQFTHRWSHMPKPPWPINVAQDMHLLLHPEWHMLHHQDHSLNFCFLSGQVGTDFILNWATRVAPVVRYDVWLTCMMAMLLLPALIDLFSSRRIAQEAMPSETTALLQSDKPPQSSSRLGLGVAATGLLLYFMPWSFQLGTYCAEFGCFQPDCHMDSCLPSYSATALYFPGSPTSHFRFIVAHVACLLRAPAMACIIFRAYQRVRESRKSAVHKLSIDSMGVALFTMAGCDVSATLLQHTASTACTHVVFSTAFLLALLGWVVPAYASAVYKQSGTGQVIWIVWALLVVDGIWLLVSWFTSFGHSVQWYVCENFIAGPGLFILFLAIGATVPPPTMASVGKQQFSIIDFQMI